MQNKIWIYEGYLANISDLRVTNLNFIKWSKNEAKKYFNRSQEHRKIKTVLP